MQYRIPTTLLAAALTLLLAACGKEKTKDFGIEENRGTQKSALEKLAVRGTAELKEIILKGTPKARKDATQALGYIRDDPEATKLILELIESPPDKETRLDAIMTLGLQGPDVAKEIFQRCIKDADVDVRVATCMGIAEYGDSTLYPLVEEIAGNDPEQMARTMASNLLYQIENGRYVPFAHQKK